MKPLSNKSDIKFLARIVFSLVIVVIFCTCESSKENHTPALSDYPIQPIKVKDVSLTDDFWLPIIKDVQEKTIEYALEKCKEEGRFENFLIAGGVKAGKVKGLMPFDDSDVYKIIEGASNSLISSPNAQLETLLDSLIDIIKVGQEKDGYLTTWRTIDPARPPAEWVKVDKGVRWEHLEASHELYNVGHMYEAASVHFLATGKKNFLDIATKNADLIVDTFGNGKLELVPGHEIIETGLIKLYRVTGKDDYLELAKYFLDSRGNHTSGRPDLGAYAQDHLPVTQQDEVVGHAVRAVYLYAGMTDVAAMYKDKSYLNAVNNLWNNMITRKMYITGGIGARHEGEAFGDDYELPNLTAYNETCAAIGSVYWNHRLFMLTGDVKYYDVIERTLYNGLISGLSLDGEKFFYPNALESDGEYKFNMGSCSRQSWFDCSCCPTNLIRFLPSVPGLIYANSGDTIYVNLYAGNEATISVGGKEIGIKQETSYPWDGNIKLTVESKEPLNFVLKLRVPGWSRGEVLPGTLYTYRDKNEAVPQIAIAGNVANIPITNGYFILDKKWDGTEQITLTFPMQVRTVVADQNLKDDIGKTSLEYGPMVFAVEEIDNKGKFDGIGISGNETYNVKMENNLLEGVNTITAKGDHGNFTAIPYYAWSNRGVGKMKVWLPVEKSGD